MLHIPLTNYHLLAAKQESYQKAYLLTKNIKEFCGEKSQENSSVGRKYIYIYIFKDTNRRGSRQKNKRGDSKVESNDSPEIPDRGKTDIPCLP